MRRERPLVFSYARAIARCRTELALMRNDLQAEFDELRRQLDEAKAELAKLRAIGDAVRTERDITQPVN
jgi:hypothetical protein